MQYSIKLFFIGVILSTLFFSCSKTNKKTPQEPNDTILKAGFIESGKSYKMKIDEEDDLDWYAMEIPSSGYVKIGSKNVPEEIDPEVRFALKQEWEGKKQKWLNSWERLPFNFTVREIDTVYFAIGDQHRNNSADKEFSFKAEFIKEFDDDEPNDKIVEAKDLEIGKGGSSYIFPKGDKEWYKISAEEQGYFLAKYKSKPDDITPEVRLAQMAEMKEEPEFISDYKRLPCGFSVNKKGEYFAMLMDDHHNNSSDKQIKWKMDFKKEMDEAEPNNSFEDAHSISIPDTLEVAVFPKGDVDLFKLSPDSDMEIKVKAKKVDDEIGPEVVLYEKKEMSEPKEVSEWKAVPTKLSLEKGKKYILKFHDDHDNNSSLEPFELIVGK